MHLIDFELRGEHIALDALLKATGVADSGGAGKAMVAAGLVQVDGQVELRKTCKLRTGQVVAVRGTRIRLHGGSATAHRAAAPRALPANAAAPGGVDPPPEQSG